VAFDNSRFTFDPWKNYSGVVMEQGRVQLDSDWNEWHAEIARRIQAGTLDIMGHAAYPATTPAAFQITASSGPDTVLIGRGRMYVDGLLAENHGLPANALWDPALAELSGSPQPPPQPPPTPVQPQPTESVFKLKEAQAGIRNKFQSWRRADITGDFCGGGASVGLKIRRASALGSSTPPPGTSKNPPKVNG